MGAAEAIQKPRVGCHPFPDLQTLNMAYGIGSRR